MWVGMHSIALIRANVIAGIGGQHTLRNIQRLVITQHGAGKATALHLGELVYQHIACSHNLAFKTQTAAEQKRLAKSTAIGEFWKVQLDGVYASQ